MGHRAILGIVKVNCKRGVDSSTLSLASLLDGDEWVVQHHAPAAIAWGRPGTHFVGGWVGPRSNLDGRVKSRPHRDSIPRLSDP